jgi:hypothetical protein
MEPPDRAEVLLGECISGNITEDEFQVIVQSFSTYELDYLSELLVEESKRFAHLEKLSQATSARLVKARANQPRI